MLIACFRSVISLRQTRPRQRTPSTQWAGTEGVLLDGSLGARYLPRAACCPGAHPAWVMLREGEGSDRESMTSSTTSPPATNRGPQRPAWLTAKRLTGLVVLALGIVLIAENSAEVKVRLLVPVVKMPMWAAFAILFAGGLLAGWLLCRRRKAAANQAGH